MSAPSKKGQVDRNPDVDGLTERNRRRSCRGSASSLGLVDHLVWKLTLAFLFFVHAQIFRLQILPLSRVVGLSISRGRERFICSRRQCCGRGPGDGSVWHVFGPPGSINTRYKSGSGGSFYYQAKIVRKTLILAVLWLLYDFLFFKNDVNVASKSKNQKYLGEKNHF